MNNFIESYIEAENTRQNDNIELIASENYPSERILNTLSCKLQNKYAEGYPSQSSIDKFIQEYPDYIHTGKIGRYYGGCENVDMIELYGRYMWQKVFNTSYHCNLQPHSGSQANMAAYAAFLKPGDKILAMSLDAGGHLTHSSSVSFVGNLYNIITYGVKDNGRINYDELTEKIIDEKPNLIVIGASAYPFQINFSAIKELIDDAVEAVHEYEWNTSYNPIFMVDMAHIAGLIAADYHPSPFGWADVITTTTHKTLRGPRGGMIFCKPEYAERIDKAVFPYCQGGSLMNVIAAKAICAEEALTLEYRTYISKVIANCGVMAERFIELGYKIVGGGTQNHLLLLDLRDTGVTGKELQEACDKYDITLNKNAIPNDPLPPSEASGVRIGTAAMTTKGFNVDDFRYIAEKIDYIIRKIKSEKKPPKTEVITICGYPLETDGFRDVAIYKNATVIVTENMRTHEYELRWMRQGNTEETDHYPVDE